MAHDVFISFSSKDKPTADAVCATLEGRMPFLFAILYTCYFAAMAWIAFGA